MKCLLVVTCEVKVHEHVTSDSGASHGTAVAPTALYLCERMCDRQARQTLWMYRLPFLDWGPLRMAL